MTEHHRERQMIRVSPSSSVEMVAKKENAANRFTAVWAPL
ncbi:hypothetical protein ACVME8_008678 [Bradyrhizobium diazoefficiens]